VVWFVRGSIARRVPFIGPAYSIFAAGQNDISLHFKSKVVRPTGNSVILSR
jgi:hypothetical protein